MEKDQAWTNTDPSRRPIGQSDGRVPAARRTPSGRRRLLVLAALTALVAATATGVFVAARPEQTSGAIGSQQRTNSVAVERTDLVARRTVIGALGYDDERMLQGLVPGIVTWLPDEGATKTRGQALFRVDNTPVILMYGSVPMYRTLAEGIDDGPDVRQLERNLAALGYEGFVVDDRFNAATANAVRKWQVDAGIDGSGAVQIGRVAFLPGPRRVGRITAAVGGASAGPIMETTSTSQIVAVDLDAILQTLAHRGDRVTITLPDGSAVRGTITKVERVAQPVSPDDPTGASTIPVRIEVNDASKVGRLDEAPVDVAFIDEQARNVLAVPVTALLALAEGGFGVEVQRDSGTVLIPVTPGLFSDGGDVEITGDLSEGDRVVVPE